MKARLFASAKISPGIRRTPSMRTGNHTKLEMRSPSSNAERTTIRPAIYERGLCHLVRFFSFAGKIPVMILRTLSLNGALMGPKVIKLQH